MTGKDVKRRVMSLGTVYWEGDPEHEREVKSICGSCNRSHSQGNYARCITDLDDIWIVSPSGVGHIQDEYHIERTLCGRDATGTDWWWRT